MINWAFGYRGLRLGEVLIVDALCFPGYLSPLARILKIRRLQTNKYLPVCDLLNIHFNFNLFINYIITGFWGFGGGGGGGGGQRGKDPPMA